MESESVASSSSPPPNHHHHHPNHRFLQSRPLADRIFRALRHRLLLLHRSESNFFVLGATGNVYTVSLSATPSCTCPDRTTPCKHILFVLIRVLGVSLDDHCLRRRNLRPCQVNRLICRPTLPDAVAGVALRERFHQLFFNKPKLESNLRRPQVEVEEGTACPVCLEEILTRKLEEGSACASASDNEKVVVACGTCRNVIHKECLMKWKRIRGRRGVICVICRSRWRDRIGINHRDNYLNLSAFVGDDHVPADHTAAHDRGHCVA